MQVYKNNGLASSIIHELGLQANKSEAVDFYHDRLILSAASAWMHWLAHSQRGPISIARLIQDTEEHVSSLIAAMAKADQLDAGIIVRYIYGLLLKNGDFYHTNLFVRPAAFRRIPVLHATLIRGMEPDLDVTFSGIAPFIKDDSDPVDLHLCFDLPEITPFEILNYVWRNAQPVNDAILCEFLQPDVQEGKQYYSSTRPAMAGPLLARSNIGAQQYEYFLTEEATVKRIPNEWINVGYHEYCRLALMNQHGKRSTPAIDFGETVRFQPAYLLPRRELSFFRYVSWPTDLSDCESPWSFHVSSALWPTVKQRLKYLGCEVNEL